MGDVASPLLKLLASLLLAGPVALAWWLPPQSAAILSAPLLIAAAIVWLQRASAPVTQPVHIEPHVPHEGLSSRARVNALESELTSLRGVQRELLAAKQAAESAMLAKSEFLAT